ncbi:transposase [Salinibacter ruber]|uniref:transposase n=1 Tax=Salinibacter ruber TaxID=146919 RepID=UPI0016213E8A
MTEHRRAEPVEQTLGRRRQENGTYERRLTTRGGPIELEVPRDREATFFSGSLPTLLAEREGARAGADAAGPIRESSPVESMFGIGANPARGFLEL